MPDLKGKVAIITGAASGIGEATAREFVDRGACVLLTDINADRGARTAKDLGASAKFVSHDVTSEDQWAAAVKEAEAAFGQVTILVNNAGIIAPGNNEGPIEAIDLSYFRKIFEVNQAGTFLGMKHVTPSMKRAGGGSIVNVSSAGGLIGAPFLTAYSASKWAVTGMTKCVALELGRYGIRVNSIHPGATWTAIHYAGQSEEQAKSTRAWLDNIAQNLAIPRTADPGEVAKMIAFVASDEASYSTGSEFVVDGGYIAM
jgi:3alpha(or 20beta)-hydroxysteroid dehydrogenase